VVSAWRETGVPGTPQKAVVGRGQNRLGHIKNRKSVIQGELPMHGIAARALAVIIAVVAFGALGLVVGAFIGGNYAQQFVFNGVRGYEATGQLGFLLGALAGLIAGWRFLFSR
jgi:hypothetical protein